MSLEGLRVISLESRRAAEIELLIRKQGGEAFVAPSVRERALSDNADAFRMLEHIEAGRFDLLILTTGVGLSFWKDVIGSRFPPERAERALRSLNLLVRGPKPAAVLRASAIVPTVAVPEPNTWREVVETVAKRPERKLALQEYGRPNAEFVEALRALGASVETFALYRWELPEDIGPLRAAVDRLAKRQADIILFTSSIQLEHLFQIAEEENLAEQVRSAMREHIAIASIGPIMDKALADYDFVPDIVPSSPKMGPLVYAAATEGHAALQKKRARFAR
jgi:uroporphyrinogen-III synthase